MGPRPGSCIEFSMLDKEGLLFFFVVVAVRELLCLLKSIKKTHSNICFA